MFIILTDNIKTFGLEFLIFFIIFSETIEVLEKQNYPEIRWITLCIKRVEIKLNYSKNWARVIVKLPKNMGKKIGMQP